ncbi:hypothetical protein LA080_012157 [Diaporthe eres]|nr:hypothetical protein LA080_012157 [Diaporthe eres]
MAMTWPGTAPSSGQSVLAVLALCGPVWFRESILALWRGPTKDREIGRNENAWPPDCSRSRRRSEEVHDAQVLACDAARLGQIHQESRIPAAGGEEDGVVPKSLWSVASSSKKPALGRAWKLAGVCLAGVRKGGALFHQPSRNSPAVQTLRGL